MANDMLEIERKILDIDVAALVKKIKKLRPASKKIFEGLVRIKYFDFKDGRVKKKKDLLRVREISPKGKKSFTELVYKTYKGVKNGCKYFEECEIRLESGDAFEAATELLKKLGFKQTVYYEKRRTLFRQQAVGTRKHVSFEIDEHPKIPAFLEIEGNEKSIVGAIKALGLEDYEQSSESIGELLARKYPKLSLKELVF